MKKRKRLIWQIFPSFLLITLLSLLAVSWYASNAMRHFFLDQTADDLKIRAILLEKQVIALNAPLDPPTVDSICKAIGGQSATRFTIILPSGKVIGDSQETPRLMDNHAKRPEIAKALSGGFLTHPKLGFYSTHVCVMIQELHQLPVFQMPIILYFHHPHRVRIPEVLA